MKIALVLHHFLPEFIGGTEIYTFTLAKYLARKNKEVVVIVPNLGIDTTEEYFYEGIRVIKYAENSLEDRNMILGKKKPSGLKEFALLIKKEQPDIVHFHELAPGRGISIFQVKRVHEMQIPLFITFHVSFYSCFKGTLVYKNEQKCDGEIFIKKCAACIYHEKNITGIKATLLNKAAMALYRFRIDTTGMNTTIGTALGLPYVIDKIKKDLLRLSLLAEKIIVIADWYKRVLEKNGINPGKIIYIGQGLPNETEEKYLLQPVRLPLQVVYIGRISKVKGLHLLIQAIKNLPATHISLDVYGPKDASEYAADLQEKTKDNGNINWKGRIPSTEVINTLSGYHLLCLPSAFEMSPLVIQEAFAAGIPVLASEVYGNAEQVTDGVNGWLFKFNDAADLQMKLEVLIHDTGLLEKASKMLPTAGSFKEVAARHLALYEAIIEKHSLV